MIYLCLNVIMIWRLCR